MARLSRRRQERGIRRLRPVATATPCLRPGAAGQDPGSGLCWAKGRTGRGGRDGHGGALVTAGDPAGPSASRPSRPQYQLSRRKAWFARPRTDAAGRIQPGAQLTALAARIAAESVPRTAPDGSAGDVASPSGPQWNPLGPADVCRGEPDGRRGFPAASRRSFLTPAESAPTPAPRAGGPGTPRTPACTGVAWTPSPRPRR